MTHINIEIKARCEDMNRIRKILRLERAIFQGLDHQVDTYFVLEEGMGRLQLREGNIENELIHYQRNNTLGPTQSDVSLYPFSPGV